MVIPTTKRNALYSGGVHFKMFLIVGSYLLGKLSQVKSSQSTRTPMHRTKTTPSISTTTMLTTTTSSTTSKKLLKECGALSLFTLLESSSQLQWKDRKMSKLNKKIKSSPPSDPLTMDRPGFVPYRDCIFHLRETLWKKKGKSSMIF